MDYIKLEIIKAVNETVYYRFSVSDSLKQFFTGKEFSIKYDESIENVPQSVLSVPFICSVLPIIWLTDSCLYIPEIDRSFYECIDQVKRGYEKMFPGALFKGLVKADAVVDNHCCRENETSAMFFSGGLDSYQTLISHLEEEPIMISIWGSDIRVNNTEGWQKLKSVIDNAAAKFQLQTSYIQSSFREFDNEFKLQKAFFDVLGDGWWHGAKHGIALLGHVAPLAYLHGIKKMYIASSHWPSLGLQKCASSPYTDNYVRFCDCQVIHDGFNYSRQDKTHNIVKFCNEREVKIDLHVCWESQTGDNCCHCEKCYRMMAGLVAEGADPLDYGFSYSVQNLIDMEKTIKTYANRDFISLRWSIIKGRMQNNIRMMKNINHSYWYKWILETDFDNPDHFRISMKNRLVQSIAPIIIEAKQRKDWLYPLRILHGKISERFSSK